MEQGVPPKQRNLRAATTIRVGIAIQIESKMNRPLNARSNRCGLRACAAALLAVAAFSASAQSRPDGRWHGGFGLGGSAASGNTNATTLALTAEATRATADDKFSLNALLNYGTSEVDGVKTRSAELARLGGRYDHDLSARMFLFAGTEGEINEPGGLDSRYSLNGGTGYHLVKTDRNTFDVIAGVGYTDARFSDGERQNGIEGMVGEESTHKLGESATFKQRFAYFPGTGSIDSRATFDATLTAAITGGWTVNTGLAVRHNSDVAPGLKKTDSLLTFGFGFKY